MMHPGHVYESVEIGISKKKQNWCWGGSGGDGDGNFSAVQAYTPSTTEDN